MQHTFLYISLPSLHDYGVKIPNFTFYGGRKRATTNLSFSFKTWVGSPIHQLQENLPTFDIFSELEWARQSLEKREFILRVRFSLPSPSSRLKLPSMDSSGSGLEQVDHTHHICDEAPRWPRGFGIKTKSQSSLLVFTPWYLLPSPSVGSSPRSHLISSVTLRIPVGTEPIRYVRFHFWDQHGAAWIG